MTLAGRDGRLPSAETFRAPSNAPTRKATALPAPSAGGTVRTLKPGDDTVHARHTPLATDTFKAEVAREQEEVVDCPWSIVLGEQIGVGAFGKVYMAMDEIGGGFYAVKESPCTPDSETYRALEKEVLTMQELNHDNIVRYHGIWLDVQNASAFVLLEFVSGGSLQAIIDKFGKLRERLIRQYTKQIITGLVYLHSRGIVHRDIKPANILVEKTGRIKLADFGAIKELVGESTGNDVLSLKGTPAFMAPELIRFENAGRKCDNWSVGGTVITMLTGKVPWTELKLSTHALMFHVAKATGPPPYDESLASPELVDFIRTACNADVKKRFSSAKLSKHHWLTPKVGGIQRDTADVMEFITSIVPEFKPLTPQSATVRLQLSVRGTPRSAASHPHNAFKIITPDASHGDRTERSDRDDLSQHSQHSNPRQLSDPKNMSPRSPMPAPLSLILSESFQSTDIQLTHDKSPVTARPKSDETTPNPLTPPQEERPKASKAEPFTPVEGPTPSKAQDEAELDDVTLSPDGEDVAWPVAPTISAPQDDDDDEFEQP